MVLHWGRCGRAGGCWNISGGVAQLGEHLPCKQGVKSSNLSVSIPPGEAWRSPYLEKSIQRRKTRHQTSTNRDDTSTRGRHLAPRQIEIKEGSLGATLCAQGPGQAGRAQGGCLGTKGRRKTRQAAKSRGEGQIPDYPWVSEWGNPRRAGPCVPAHESIVRGRAPGELKHLSSRRRRRQK